MTTKNRVVPLSVLLCFLAYTAAYIGRLNYSASIHVILPALGADKATGGMVASAFFLCYGVGQLINGLLCTKYNAKIAIFIGLCASAVINLVFAFVGNVYALIALWALNGLVQSLLWCNIVRIIASEEVSRARAAVVMSATLPIGTFLAYGLSALCIWLNNWRAAFVVAAAVLSVVAAVWLTLLKVPSAPSESHADGGERGKGTILLLCFFAAAALCNGFLRDGTVSWTPSLLHEVHGTPDWLATVITLALPIVSLLGVFLAQFLLSRLKNHATAMAVCFLASGALITALLMVYAKTATVSVLLLSAVACAMAAVNNMITLIIPLYFKRAYNSGTLAGVLNTCCYGGSTAAAFGLGALIDGAGWDVYYFALLAAAALGAAALVVAKICHARGRENIKDGGIHED